MLLSASGLKVGYLGNELFSSISFMVQASDKIGVIGDNGCGNLLSLPHFWVKSLCWAVRSAKERDSR